MSASTTVLPDKATHQQTRTFNRQIEFGHVLDVAVVPGGSALLMEPPPGLVLVR